MTKTQIRAIVDKIKDELFNAGWKIKDLQSDVEEESENIEPYEGRNELTPQQEERQEWLENASETLEQAINDFDELISTLEEIGE